jgi:cell wall-associated NlpC family hydrolase
MYIVSHGDAAQITSAKERIKGALIGLFLLLGSYTMLYIINPDLVKFNSLKIKVIERTEFSGETFDTDGSFAGDLGKATTLGINCPGNGGAAVLKNIVDSFKNKVVYRMGGKGGPPPYMEFAENYKKYNDSCPTGSICLDCTGFVSYIYKCAGLPVLSGGTSSIFSSAEKIDTIDWAGNKINNIALKPGDALGWRAEDPGNAYSSGHIVMYLGDGLVVETAGGEKNRQNPYNPYFKTFSSLEINKKYMFRWIKRL